MRVYELQVVKLCEERSNCLRRKEKAERALRGRGCPGLTLVKNQLITTNRNHVMGVGHNNLNIQFLNFI